jgi:hypothetical protein
MDRRTGPFERPAKLTDASQMAGSRPLDAEDPLPRSHYM